MKKLIILIIMFMAFQDITAQNYSEWSSQELAKANTAQNTNLSEQEKLVFFYCNLARLDGAKFMRTYAANYLNKQSSYVQSLKRDLAQVKGRPMLCPEKNLCLSAKFHAVDMGQHNMTGHNSSDGTGCFQRIDKYYKGGGYRAENCSYGFSDALDIVMQLLIDEGVSSLGHRTNILNGKYVAMGTSIQPHGYYSYNCVMDFSDNLVTPLGGTPSQTVITEEKQEKNSKHLQELPVSGGCRKKFLKP